MLVSIVIRTLNEEKYLEELLEAISCQKSTLFEIETVIVDSGSTDKTLEIADRYKCRITHISKEEFTFGRSLNLGSNFADGDILVYVSGHCIPVNDCWVDELCKPIVDGVSSYVYGGQVGRDTTKFSEIQLFKKYFPAFSKVPQKGFFINNANAAISRNAWKIYKFNEEITGLEDMELAKRLCDHEYGKIAYIAEAKVYHIHDESWQQTRRRYEREAIALQKIMPEVHITKYDTFRYLTAGVLSDFSEAIREGCFLNNMFSIIKFRSAQYLGTYIGNHEHRVMSKVRKEIYYYPTKNI